MIIEADRNGCLHEVLVIVSALSIQDPRERPAEKRPQADLAHARFADSTSDFLALLNLWNYLGGQQKALSGNQFRKLCQREFLHFLRLREWQDLLSQLRRVTRDLGLKMSRSPEDAIGIHRSLLAGLLTHVGVREGDRDYLGVRNARFAIWPGSALARKPPGWVMAAELIETSRLFGRMVARTDPETIEKLAGHLVVRTCSEPHWDAKRGAVMAVERVTLYGVPLIAGRQANYGSIDAVLSRELFIRHALVEGDWSTHHAFFMHNQRVLDDVEALEDRVRRRDIRIDDEALFALYDAHIGPDVVSARHFDSWWKRARRTSPDLLTFNLAMLTNAATASAASHESFPDVMTSGELRLPLTYRFDPGAIDDGVTVDVPLAVVNQVSGDALSWTVPGLREELVTALLRTLPKGVRRNLVPIPDTARAIMPALDQAAPLLPALEGAIRRRTGVDIPQDAWQTDAIPAHLRVSFRIVDEDDRTLAQGRDMTALRDQVAPALQATLRTGADDLTRTGSRDWDLGSVPRAREIERGAHRLRLYPTLVDEGASVGVRVVDSPYEQVAMMRLGVRRLLLLTMPSPTAALGRSLSTRDGLLLRLSPYPSIAALIEDCVACATDDLVAANGGAPYDEPGFRVLQVALRQQLRGAVTEVLDRVVAVMSVNRDVEAALSEAPGRHVPAAAIQDLRQQLMGLVYPGFISATGRARLKDLPRYLRAMLIRLEALPREAPRDAAWQATVDSLAAEWQQLLDTKPSSGALDADLDAIRWMLEELRVSFFAQSLGTAGPVSEKRIVKAMDRITARPPARGLRLERFVVISECGWVQRAHQAINLPLSEDQLGFAQAAGRGRDHRDMTEPPRTGAGRLARASRRAPFRKAGRRTNLALFVALVGSFASGWLAFGIGTPVPAAITTVTHGVLGLALVVLIPWKNAVVGRASRKAVASLTLLGVMALCVVAGVVAVLGGFPNVCWTHPDAVPCRRCADRGAAARVARPAPPPPTRAAPYGSVPPTSAPNRRARCGCGRGVSSGGGRRSGHRVRLRGSARDRFG